MIEIKVGPEEIAFPFALDTLDAALSVLEGFQVVKDGYEVCFDYASADERRLWGAAWSIVWAEQEQIEGRNVRFKGHTYYPHQHAALTEALWASLEAGEMLMPVDSLTCMGLAITIASDDPLVRIKGELKLVESEVVREWER